MQIKSEEHEDQDLKCKIQDLFMKNLKKLFENNLPLFCVREKREDRQSDW
jgi:hypothetical protein